MRPKPSAPPPGASAPPPAKRDFWATWTRYKGEPVYWLAPEYWAPERGSVCLVLPGEDPGALSAAERVKRSIEFLVLQGDNRYCTPTERERMRRLMRERLGTDTPWRGIPPQAPQLPPEPVPAAAPAPLEAPF